MCRTHTNHSCCCEFGHARARSHQNKATQLTRHTKVSSHKRDKGPSNLSMHARARSPGPFGWECDGKWSSSSVVQVKDMPPSGALLLITMTNSQTNVIYALGQKVQKSGAGFAAENYDLWGFRKLFSTWKIFGSFNWPFEWKHGKYHSRKVICSLFLKIGYLSDIKEQKTNAHKGLPSRSLLFRKRFWKGWNRLCVCF